MYVCQSVLFVQPIRSFNLISMLVHCLHMKITTCLLVLINQLRKLDNSYSCELVCSLSAYESCLIYLEQSCQSYIIPMDRTEGSCQLILIQTRSTISLDICRNMKYICSKSKQRSPVFLFRPNNSLFFMRIFHNQELFPVLQNIKLTLL